MTGRPTPRVATPLVAAALVAALLGGQALSGASTEAAGAQTAASVGRAGFAYLTGLRRFAALLLWSKLDPQYHGYYASVPIKDQAFFMPNMQLILMLDPQFVQAHYLVSWVVAENGRTDEALALAREAVEQNPRSGLLHVSYAQLLYLKTTDLTTAVEQADYVLRDDTVWADAVEEWQAAKIAADIFAKAGLPDKQAQALAIAKQIDTDLGGAPGFRDPDEQF